jgi:hypothetical protein
MGAVYPEGGESKKIRELEKRLEELTNKLKIYEFIKDAVNLASHYKSIKIGNIRVIENTFGFTTYVYAYPGYEEDEKHFFSAIENLQKEKNLKPTKITDKSYLE